MKSKKLLLTTFAIIPLIIFASLTPVAASGPSRLSQPFEPECNPVALWLVQWMDVDCAVLMDYQARGVGFGVIRQAYTLSQAFDSLDWEELVEMHLSEEGLGWGEIIRAQRLSNRLGLTPEDLLAQRAQGLGWGEILQEYRDGPGKPPWAGGPPKADEEKSEKSSRTGQGPPPWAHPGKPPKVDPHSGQE
jgi:hypothetical protein